MFTVDYQGQTYNAAAFAAARQAYVDNHSYPGTLADWLHISIPSAAEVDAAYAENAHRQFLADNPDPIVYQLQRYNPWRTEACATCAANLKFTAASHAAHVDQ